MACVSPLSMLAVSMFDMASMVVSLSEEMAACFQILPSLYSSRLFNECIMFMNEVKYLQQRQYKLVSRYGITQEDE